MKDKVFIDTNILVYAFLTNQKEKHEKSERLLSSLAFQETEVFVSTQILSEIYSALTKNNIEHDLIKNYLFEIDEIMNVYVITFSTIKKCLDIKERYKYSYWDSLVLASSLESGLSFKSTSSTCLDNLFSL